MSVRLGFAIGLLATATGCNLVFSASETDAAALDARLGPDAQRGVPNYIGPGDFDGDGMPNSVDPCPAKFNLVASDVNDDDGDGLPNACDPHQVVGSNDCLVFFDGFTNRVGAPLDSRWMVDSGGSLSISQNALTFASDGSGRGFAHFELDVAADYAHAFGMIGPGITGANDFVFAGLSASFEQPNVQTFFGGAHAINAAGVLQPATLATSSPLVAKNGANCGNLPFAGTGSLSVELSTKFIATAQGCSHNEPVGLAGHKIAIGLARAKIELDYIAGTRKLSAGQFCEHSKRLF